MCKEKNSVTLFIEHPVILIFIKNFNFHFFHFHSYNFIHDFKDQINYEIASNYT